MKRRLAVAAIVLLLGVDSGAAWAQAPKDAVPSAAPFSAVKGEPKAETTKPAAAAETKAKWPEAKAKRAETVAAPTEVKAGEVKAGEAKTAAKSPSALKLEPNQKLCRSKLPEGGVKSWICGKEQPCCVNHAASLYSCGSQLLKCF